MRKFYIVVGIFLTVASFAFGAGSTPIAGLKLIGDANGNNVSLTNMYSVAFRDGSSITGAPTTVSIGAVSTNDTTYTSTVAKASSALQSFPTLQQVVTSGATVVSVPVTFDLANAVTNIFGGRVTVLGVSVRAGTDNTNGTLVIVGGQGNTVNNYGLGCGYLNTIGIASIGGGQNNTFGHYTLGNGQYNTVGDYSFGAGRQNTIGDYGFVAGRQGKGAIGSFVFSDNVATDFDRLAVTNGFSIRASGGAYLDVPTLIVTGTVAAASFSGSGAGITGLPGASVVGSVNSALNSGAPCIYDVSGNGIVLASTNGSQRWSIYLTNSWVVSISPAMIADQQFDLAISYSTSNWVVTLPAGTKMQQGVTSLAITNTTGFLDQLSICCVGTNATLGVTTTNAYRSAGTQ
jgi:hypothetical protein